jgi:hypothetical protein
MGFWIIWFTDHLQVVSRNNCHIFADFQTLQIPRVHAKSFPACSVFTRRFLLTASNNGYSSATVVKSSLNGGSFPTALLLRVRLRVALRLAVYRQSVSLGAEPLETHGQNFFPQLNTCGHSPYITFSLMRGWVCHLQLLLALASAFILGSETRGTRDHILLSRIRDFPFCRLLRLAGLQWRYSTPPPQENQA